MAGGPAILAKFMADTSQLVGGVDKATSDMSSALSGFAAKAALAIGAAFAVDKVIDFAKGGVEAAINAEQSANRLALTLKNVTGATTDQVKANEDFLSSLSKTTVISKGELRPAMDSLVRGFENTEQAQKALALATDISAGSGKDLASVATALMKAGDGSTTALRKLGIEVKGVDGKARPLNDIMAELGETFQGQAAAKAESAGGKLAAVGLQFAAFQTQVGKALLPAVAAVGSFLAETVLPAIASIVGPAAAALGSFVTTTVVPAIQQLAAIVLPVFNEVVGGVKAFIGAFTDGSDEITSSGFAGFLEGLGVTARNAFDAIGPSISNFVAAVQPLIADALPKIADFFTGTIVPAVQSFADEVGRVGGTVATWFTERLLPAVRDFANALGPLLADVAPVLGKIAAVVGGALLAAFVTLGPAIGTALGGLGSLLSDTVLPALTAIVTWATSHGDEVKAVLVGIGVAVTASVIPPMLAWIATTISLIPTAVGLFGIWVAGALSAAAATLLAALPFILIGVAIAAVALIIIKNWDTISAVVSAVFGAIVGAAQTVIAWLTENWQTIVAIITGPIGIAIALVRANWDTITAAVGAVIAWITEHWQTIVAVITGPIGIVVAVIISHWDTIRNSVQILWDFIVNAWNSIASGIGAAIEAIGGFISTLVDVFFKRPIAAAQELYDAVSGKFSQLLGFIEGIVGSIGDAIGHLVDAMKAPINAFLRAFNDLSISIPTIDIPKVDVPFVGTVGGGSFGGFRIDFPNLPLLAGGGVLSRPTMFVGGEAGTEIVAPESLLRSIVRQESGGANYTLNLYPRTADANDIAHGFQRLELLAGLA